MRSRCRTGRPKERYYDPEFYALEAEQLWPRVWQMACRLEEIPEPGDFVTYEILDQSVIVRARPTTASVRAFQNTCRHRGVRLVEGPGQLRERLHLLVPRLVLRPRRRQHPHPHAPKSFDLHNLAGRRHRPHPGAVRAVGRRARGSTSTPTPRRCASRIEPAASILDAWEVESLRTEWWYACRLPVNWKLAEQAFQEQYHVVQSHPQLVIPGMRYGAAGRRLRPPGVRRRRDPVPAAR